MGIIMALAALGALFDGLYSPVETRPPPPSPAPIEPPIRRCYDLVMEEPTYHYVKTLIGRRPVVDLVQEQIWWNANQTSCEACLWFDQKRGIYRQPQCDLEEPPIRIKPRPWWVALVRYNAGTFTNLVDPTGNDSVDQPHPDVDRDVYRGMTPSDIQPVYTLMPLPCPVDEPALAYQVQIQPHLDALRDHITHVNFSKIMEDLQIYQHQLTWEMIMLREQIYARQRRLAYERAQYLEFKAAVAWHHGEYWIPDDDGYREWGYCNTTLQPIVTDLWF